MTKKKEPELWKRFEVKMDFEYRLCGSVPQSKKIVPLWLESRMPKKKPEDAKPIKEVEQEVLDSIEETQERTTLGFQKDDLLGLWVRGGTIKAHLKDCANQIKDIVKIKAFRSKVANAVYVEAYRVWLTKKGKRVLEPDGSYEQPVHIMTRQGPRSALKVINFVESPKLRFYLLL